VEVQGEQLGPLSSFNELLTRVCIQHQDYLVVCVGLCHSARYLR
jgi:hypothetical protein